MESVNLRKNTSNAIIGKSKVWGRGAYFRAQKSYCATCPRLTY